MWWGMARDTTRSTVSPEVSRGNPPKTVVKSSGAVGTLRVRSPRRRLVLLGLGLREHVVTRLGDAGLDVPSHALYLCSDVRLMLCVARTGS